MEDLELASTVGWLVLLLTLTLTIESGSITENLESRMARKKADTGELSAKALQDQIAEMEAERKRLEAALKQRLASEITDFAKEIAATIAERGYQVDEVVALLRKGKRSAPRRRGSGAYAHYVDPDNPENTYSRGPLPKWLTEKMIAAGFDPSDKTQREEFKANHLNRVG